MDNLGEIIKQARLKVGLSLGGLAWAISSRIGRRVDANYIAHLESGGIKRPDKERLSILAEILEIPADKLYRLADYYPNLEPLGEMVQIPMGDISAGPGTWKDEIFYLPKNRVTSERLVGYEVKGTSMEPAIPENSIVVVDLENPAKPRDIVVAWTSEGGIIKHLVEKENKMMLAGNTGDPIPVDDSVHIEGPVIFVGKFL